jgi:glutamate-1-semialdehyde aminotransferase
MAAALATIHEFKTRDVIAHNHGIGRALSARVQAAIAKAGLGAHVDFQPSEWMPLWGFRDRGGAVSMGVRTLALQEMIARGVLWGGFHNVCAAHDDAAVAHVLAAYDEVLPLVARAVAAGNVRELLRGEPVEAVFRKTSGFNTKPAKKGA